MPERTKVENPFTLGPSTTIKESSPDLQSRVIPKQRPAPLQSGLEIVDSLVKFAGVAGSEYIKNTEKKLEADKAVQTARAVEGLIPTSDATKAGYQAHAAVSIKSKTLAAQARLNQLAEKRTTDDEWEEAIREEYRVLDEYMMGNYETYAKDIDLQKLSAVSLRETIPQVTATREGWKLEHEIEDRITSATDVLVNGAATGTLSNIPPEDMLEGVDGMLAPLQLTASQKDAVITRAIEVSDDPALIEFSKIYKGDRSTSLYDRTGKIQAVDKANKNQDIANSAINLAQERIDQKESLLSGEMTWLEFTNHAGRRNGELNNKYMSGAQLESARIAYNKSVSTDFVKNRVKEKILNPDVTNLDGEDKKVVQATYIEMLADREVAAKKDAIKLRLDETKTKELMDNSKATTIRYIGDQSIEKNTPISNWVSDLKNLATMNVDTHVVEGDVEGTGVANLPPKAKEAIFLLDSMTDVTKDKYIDALKNEKDKRTLKAFLNLREMDVPETLALKRAQALTRDGGPVDFEGVKEGAAEVRSSLEWSWFRKDIRDEQSEYLDQVMRDMVATDPFPSSDRNIKTVSNWLKNDWTTTSNGTRLHGSNNQLSDLMKADRTVIKDGKVVTISSPGLHISRLDSAISGLIEENREELLRNLSVWNLGIESVFPVTDPKDGTIALHANSVGEVMAKKWSLSEMPTFAANRKVKLEKAAYELKKKRIELKNAPLGLKHEGFTKYLMKRK